MTHDDRDEKRGVEKDAEADVKDIFREMGDWELSEANSKVLRDLYSGKRKAPSVSDTEEGGVPIEPGA